MSRSSSLDGLNEGMKKLDLEVKGEKKGDEGQPRPAACTTAAGFCLRRVQHEYASINVCRAILCGRSGCPSLMSPGTPSRVAIGQDDRPERKEQRGEEEESTYRR